VKVVLDTNVIVAAFATQGLCHALLELCVDQHEIMISHEILREVEAAFQKKLKVPPSVVKDTTDYLTNHASVQRPKRLTKQTSRDPSDDHILALAQLSQADYIITGDEDLLVLKTYGNIPIVLPRQFWEILKSKKRQPE
jgi:putative PIN family toxin of toxin-antitoxin system